MHPTRREILHLGSAAAIVAAAPSIVVAQPYPSRPARIVVGFAAGGPTDVVARLMGQWLSERLGQQFVVENRTGAAGNVATEAALKAPADGYTLLLVTSSNAVNATLYERSDVNLIRDVAPVAGIIRTPLVMVVNPSVPVGTIPELIAYARANPRKLNFASGGIGTSLHVAGELFKMMAGVDLVHVPYRGSAPALTDMISGHVQVMFDILTSSIEHVRSGALRPLAVTTATRSPVLSDLPTVAEFVPGYEASAWYGIAVPKNTSAERIDVLNKQSSAGLADPRLKARFAELGGTVIPGSPADFGTLVAEETEKWAKVVRFSGMKPDLIP
jgi:tripartite-type tricarboxylate transporter receptor subunit TctC